MARDMDSFDRSVTRSIVSSQGATRNFRQAMLAGSKWGSQMQYTGRQINANFGIPLAIAGGAALKFALDNERALTRVIKVYGDGTEVMSNLAKTEIPALERAFEALSNRFGVAQADAINIAADWAAAGSSGLALAKSVKLTMETMILGELEAAEATTALIAIQAQFGQSTEELAKTIDVLNMTENQTGISMQGLVQGFSRAAGVARSAGVDVEHLAAMLAALSPASGSAANAGNGLKTIISRLLAPTGEASDILQLMGIRTAELGWKSLNASQRLELLATKFDGLSDAQKAVVSATLASRYQINRFDVLMRDVINTNGYYQSTLRATGDELRNYRQRVFELNAVLDSNPQKMKQIGVVIQNTMASAIQPLLPLIVYLGQQFALLAQIIANTNPAYLKLAAAFLGIVLVFGLLTRIVGASMLLFFTFGRFVTAALIPVALLGKGIIFLAAAPFGLLTSLVTGLVGALLFLPVAIFKAGAGLVTAMPKILGIMAAGFKAMVALTRALVFSQIVLMSGLYPLLLAISYMGGKALTTLWRGITLAFGAQALLMRAVLVPIWIGTFVAMGTGLAAVGRELLILWRAITWSFGLAWITFQVAFMKIYRAMFISMAVVMQVASVQLPKLWASIWFAMTYITQTAGRTILAIWALTMNMMRTIMFTAGATMAAGWQAILMVMRAAAFAMGFTAAAMVFAVKTVVMSPAVLVPIFARAWSLVLEVMRGALSGMLLMSRAFMAVLLSPWALLVLAIIGILYSLRDRLGGIWQSIVDTSKKAAIAFTGIWASVAPFFSSVVSSIVRAFNRLPKGVRDSFMAVVKIVQSAAMAVYDLFSYFNPFARHSPSLVDNVVAGTNKIVGQFGVMGSSVGSILAKAKADLQAYKKVATGLGVDTSQFATERTDVSAALPSAVPVFDTLVGDLAALNAEMIVWDALVKDQESTVAGWTDKLDTANAEIDAQRNKLTQLQDVLNGLTDAYASHENALQSYASAPLSGMGAMSDKIFENEMAQKRLRLEMMKYEDANGSIDSVRNRLALLQGDIESGNSEVNDLRLAGAGSDITGPLLAQVAAMEAERGKIENAIAGSGGGNPMEAMEKELARLQREGERLDLENSIEFDPLIREIEKLANVTREMSFDEIVAGINRERAAMAALEPQIAAATEAVKAQEGAIKSAEAARDAIQASYDAEAVKLDKMKQSYDEVADAISSVEDALRELGGMASTKISLDEAAKKAKEAGADETAAAGAGAIDKLSPAAQNFIDAEGGDFPEVGGFAQIGREGGMEDQAPAIDDFTAGIVADTAAMFGEFDMFAPIKDMWNSTWTWIKDNIGPFVMPIWNGLKDFFTKDNIFGGASAAGGWFNETFGPVGGWFSTLWGGIKTAADSAWAGMKAIWGFFAEDFSKIWDAVLQGFKTAWNELGPAVSAFFPLIMPALEALWNIFKVIAGIVGGALLGAFKLISSVLAEALGPALDLVIGLFANFLDFVRGFAQVLIGIFTGDFGMIKDGVVTIFESLWDTVKLIFEKVPQILWGIVEGLFKGIWDILKVAGPVLWDIIKGMWDGIKDIFQAAYDALPGPLQTVIDVIVGIFKFLWNTVEGIFKAMWGAIKFLFDNVAKPIFDAIVAIFKGVGTAFEFVYENVLKPVLGFIGDRLKDLGEVFKFIWENVVKPIWDIMWGTIKRVWETIGLIILIAIVGAVKVMGAIFGWIWENVIKPAWTMFVDGIKKGWEFGKKVLEGIGVALDVLGQVFEDIWNVVIKPVWDHFVNGLKILWDSVGKPLFDGIKGVLETLGDFFGRFWEERVKPGWNSFLDGMKTLWDKVGKPMINGIITGINAAIGAINGLFTGLNWVGEKLGIGLKITLIPEIPKFAQGGTIPSRGVGAGFRTSGARAIVGEGNSNHPEYVIPTDPRFRNRALQLMGNLGQELGGVPAFARGGVLPETGGPLDTLKSIGATTISAAERARQAAMVTAARTAVKVGDVANSAVGLVRGVLAKGFQPFLNTSNGLIDKIPIKMIQDIVKKARDKFTDWVKGKDNSLPVEIAGGVGGAGGSGAVPGSGWGAVVTWLRANSPNTPYRVTSTYRPGDDGYHGQGRAVDLAGLVPSVDSPSLLAINRALLPIAGTLKELIYAGPGGQSFKNGTPSSYSAGVRAIHHNHVHAALAEGGITTGPTTALIGEAGPEAVIPLTKFWQRLNEGFLSVITTLNSNHYATITRMIALESYLSKTEAETKLREYAFEAAAVARDQALNTLLTESFTEFFGNMKDNLEILVDNLVVGFESVASAVTAGADAIGANVTAAVSELGGMINEVKSIAEEAKSLAETAQTTANQAVSAAASAAAAAASAETAAAAAAVPIVSSGGGGYAGGEYSAPYVPPSYASTNWQGANISPDRNWTYTPTASMYTDPSFLKFADGGIVNKATPGVFGEAGPEAVIPLAVLWRELDSAFLESNKISSTGFATLGDAVQDMVTATRERATYDPMAIFRGTPAQRIDGQVTSAPVNRVEATGTTKTGRTVNLYGNLVLPNIRSSEDADKLIRNLESLAD